MLKFRLAFYLVILGLVIAETDKMQIEKKEEVVVKDKTSAEILIK